ncbi:MAG TPA: DUF72 domain-containing protein [Saprospiraceae bacterium]|nr:DUF72 domain-containing protein [Saprospiraceae bacterium]
MSSSAIKDSGTRFWIGCSGFYNRHWKEVFYPDHVRQKDWFRYYCEHLNTLEINTTFYKFPTIKSLEKWYNDSPLNFRFSVKAPRLITHFKKMNECEILLEDFYNACLLGLQEKMGCFLFQFPPSYTYSPERLQSITGQLRQGLRNVVEFRHASWWDEHVLKVLEKYNIIFCMPDHPLMPEIFLDDIPFSYIRLHGNPVLFYSNYEKAFLESLKEGLYKNTESEDIYIYFNNTAGTAGILNALELNGLVDH